MRLIFKALTFSSFFVSVKVTSVRKLERQRASHSTLEILLAQRALVGPMNKITPCLWFDDKGEEAANFYVSIFKNSKTGRIARYGEEGSKVSGRGRGTVMTVTFQLGGQEFMALNGGPMFKFTEAISFSVNCETQEEVDELWEKLSLGGEEGPCGWLKDKYGVSWQINPRVLGEMLQDKDAGKSERVMKAMLQMKKIDIAKLKQAYEGR